MAYPLSPTDLFCAARDGCSKGGEAVQNGGPDLKFGHLVVDVTGHDVLARELEASHLGVGMQTRKQDSLTA
jgi:hypothetical protein